MQETVDFTFRTLSGGPLLADSFDVALVIRKQLKFALGHLIQVLVLTETKSLSEFIS